MKKIVLVTLVLMTLVFSLASCSDGSAGIGESFNAVGTWKYIDARTGLPATWDDRLIFKSDKTWEKIYEGKITASGTWDYADSWDKTSYGVELLTGFGSGSKYIPYDPTTKELVFDVSFDIQKFRKQ